MDANTRTIKQLFETDRRYVIPIFQRPYVWKQDEQWDPLWEDVRNAAERCLEELDNFKDSTSVPNDKVGAHFLGAIVLQQIPTPTIDLERRDVIDGQQRMLTLQLLLNAARTVMNAEGYGKEAKQLSKLIFNDADFAKGDDIFKIWPSSVDQDAFRSVMSEGDSAGFNSLLAQAHEFFILQIAEWFRAGDGGSQQKATSLVMALLGLLEMVVIDLTSSDDANKIFETLNARGTPLIASDLIKNYILHTAKIDGLDSENLYKTKWVEFEDKWWRKEIRQGRIFRPRIDIFLNYWLVARLKKEVQSHDVFSDFRAYSENSGGQILQVLDDIKRSGKSFEDFDNFNPFTQEGTFFYRWNTMQAGVATPLLLNLFSADTDVLSPEQRSRCLGVLESFLVRRMICRMTGKDYNRLFVELISRLDGNLHNADSILLEYFREQGSESRLFPDDAQVQSALIDLPLYRLLTRGRLRFILEAIEDSMRSTKTEERNVLRGSLTIEHVLPQNWQAHWPLDIPAGNVDQDAYKDRERLKHTIGNLTLVTERLNPALSNAPWKRKRDELNKHSVLFMNKRLLEDHQVVFNEQQIQERGMALARIVCGIWPSVQGFS